MSEESEFYIDETIERRINVLVFLPRATATISVISSSMILFTIYRTKVLLGSGYGCAGCLCGMKTTTTSSTTANSSTTKLTTYHRLLSAVAAFDVIFSTGLALGPLPIPSETGVPGAHGNTASCSFQAFMLQVGIGAFGYTTSLMLYYLLVVRCGVTDTTMSRYIEPWLHFVPVTFHLSTAISGLFLDVYNPQGPSRCWVAPYPPGCEYEDSGVGECTRGGPNGSIAHMFGSYLLVLPQVLYTLLSLVFIIIIAFTVWKRYRLSNRHRFRGSVSSTLTRSKRQMKLVVTQCFLYGVAFLNVTVWGVIITFLEEVLEKQIDILGRDFWLGVVVNTFLPLQGFFFFLIYIRPRYLTLRRELPEIGRWHCFRMAITHPVPHARSGGTGSGRVSSDPNRQLSYRVSSGGGTDAVVVSSTTSPNYISPPNCKVKDDGSNSDQIMNGNLEKEGPLNLRDDATTKANKTKHVTSTRVNGGVEGNSTETLTTEPLSSSLTVRPHHTHHHLDLSSVNEYDQTTDRQDCDANVTKFDDENEKMDESLG